MKSGHSKRERWKLQTLATLLLVEQYLNLVGVGRSALNQSSKRIVVKPPHTGYMISGRMKVVMDDGTEQEYGPGDVVVIPPGHNAWVVGNEPVINIDFTGFKDYAKPG